MDDAQVGRNRRITGTLLAMRNTAGDEYDMDGFFEHRVDDFLETPAAAAFSMLLAARLIGDAARKQRGFGEHDFVGLGLPAAAHKDPDIVMAFRLTIVVMNRDVAMAQSMVELVTKSRSRSRNVLACLIGMLMESPTP